MWREHSRSRRDSWDANTAALTRLHGNSDCREKKLLCKFWKSWFTLRLWFGGEKWPGRWCWVFQGHEFDAGWVLPTFEMGRPSWTSLSLSVLLPNHSSHARLTTLMVIATTLEIRLSLPHSQTWSQPWKVLSAKFCSRCSAHVSDYNPAPPMEGFELQSWRSLTESVGGRGYCCSAARRREEGGGDLCNNNNKTKHCRNHILPHKILPLFLLFSCSGRMWTTPGGRSRDGQQVVAWWPGGCVISSQMFFLPSCIFLCLLFPFYITPSFWIPILCPNWIEATRNDYF